MSQDNVWEWLLEWNVFQLLLKSRQRIGRRDIVRKPDKPHYRPHPWTRPTYGAKGHPETIRRFPQCTGQTDRRKYARTDRPTDRPRASLMTIARYASNESDAA